MAVYSQLSTEELSALVARWDVGPLLSAKGIAEGISNSNWLIETGGGPGGNDDQRSRRHILTIYERRIHTADLPFFLGLLDHLSNAGCPVPRTLRTREGAGFTMVGDKAAALIEFMPGLSPSRPSAQQAHAVGRALAGVHLASADYAGSRGNDLGPAQSAAILSAYSAAQLETIDSALPPMAEAARSIARQWPMGLPSSIIHSDLFPDNVLMTGDTVSGLIDFYFACTDSMAYDLAVTHAAWSFAGPTQGYRAEVGSALVKGYESVRQLTAEERDALPVLAQGACLRFIASRTADWFDTPPGALVTRKDPMEFVRLYDFYNRFGADSFA